MGGLLQALTITAPNLLLLAIKTIIIIIASEKFMHNKLAKLIKNCDPLYL